MWNAKFTFVASLVAATSFGFSRVLFVQGLLPLENNNPVKAFLGAKKNQQLKLEKEFQQLKVAADEAIHNFEDLLQEAVTTKTQELTEAVAVQVIKMLTGEWALSILTVTHKTPTSTLMENAVEDMAQDLAAVGVEVSKSELEQSGIKYTTTLDDTAYPFRLETKIMLEETQVVKYYGQLQFDWKAKRVVYALDEMEVFGVKIDLESTVMKDAAGHSVEETTEENVE